MMRPDTKNRRVLVVGAKFGELYLNAFLQSQAGLELAGLLATGSTRAQQLAQGFGIPLYTDVAQVPDDIDIACVVVRSTVAGGSGTTLAEAFLQRGMHVLQEHPMHPHDVERLQRLARELGRTYWINSFYAHTPAGRCWIERARRIRRLLDDTPAHFAHLTTSRQLLYSSLDLLLRAYGAEPVSITAGENEEEAFRLLRVGLPGCRAALRLQTYMDPDDPDLHSLIMHQLTLGWPSGYLSLEASYGPVLWTPALYDPRHRDAERSLYHSACDPDDPFSHPATLTLHPAPPDWRHALEIDAPAGVVWVLQTLRRHLDGADMPMDFQPERQLQLARLWREALRCADSAHERSLPPPRILEAQALLAPGRCETQAET
jgi:yersiniabactin synthetase, thiazolinyl reductase component